MKAGLYLRLTVNGQRSVISLHRKIDPEKWDSRMNKLKGKGMEAEELNRSSTILLHGKKMREATKLEDEINIMRQRRNATRRRIILATFYYVIQSLGLIVLYVAWPPGYRRARGQTGNRVQWLVARSSDYPAGNPAWAKRQSNPSIGERNQGI